MIRKILTGFFICCFAFAKAQFWTETSSGFTSSLTGLSKFHVVDTNVAWAVAYDGVNTSNNIQQFSKTADGGSTWTVGAFDLGDSNLGIADVSGIDANTAFVAAYPRLAGQQGGIWKTTDAGVTWNQQTGAAFNNASSFPNVVHYFDANTGIAIGDPANGYWEIYLSNNGGATYTRVPSANLPAPLANEFGYLAQFAYSGNSIWFTTNAGRIIHSTDRGVTWNVYQSPLSDFGGTTISGDISFATPDRGVIQSNTGGIFKSTDAGQTWTNVIFSGTGTPYGGAIAYLRDTFHMVSTGGDVNFAGSSYSLDDGVTWINVDTEQHVDCAFFNDRVGYSGGFSDAANNQGVFNYTGVILSETSIDREVDVRLFHENETSVLVIQTDLQLEKVTIYDLSGRIVTISKENRINTNQLHSGIYLSKIDTDLGDKTIRFLKQ